MSRRNKICAQNRRRRTSEGMLEKMKQPENKTLYHSRRRFTWLFLLFLLIYSLNDERALVIHHFLFGLHAKFNRIRIYRYSYKYCMNSTVLRMYSLLFAIFFSNPEEEKMFHAQQLLAASVVSRCPVLYWLLWPERKRWRTYANVRCCWLLWWFSSFFRKVIYEPFLRLVAASAYVSYEQEKRFTCSLVFDRRRPYISFVFFLFSNIFFAAGPFVFFILRILRFLFLNSSFFSPFLYLLVFFRMRSLERIFIL